MSLFRKQMPIPDTAATTGARLIFVRPDFADDDTARVLNRKEAVTFDHGALDAPDHIAGGATRVLSSYPDLLILTSSTRR